MGSDIPVDGLDQLDGGCSRGHALGETRIHDQPVKIKQRVAHGDALGAVDREFARVARALESDGRLHRKGLSSIPTMKRSMM